MTVAFTNFYNLLTKHELLLIRWCRPFVVDYKNFTFLSVVIVSPFTRVKPANMKHLFQAFLGERHQNHIVCYRWGPTVDLIKHSPLFEASSSFISPLINNKYNNGELFPPCYVPCLIKKSVDKSPWCFT